MTHTLTLWDTGPHPRARAVDTQTALDAARSITPGRTEALILQQFGMCFFGMTDDELAGALAPAHAPTVKTARSRLSKRGRLIDSGRRRPSVRGRDQIVWVLAEGNQP